jgi:hypothetical protein
VIWWIILHYSAAHDPRNNTKGREGNPAKGN